MGDKAGMIVPPASPRKVRERLGSHRSRQANALVRPSNRGRTTGTGVVCSGNDVAAPVRRAGYAF